MVPEQPNQHLILLKDIAPQYACKDQRDILISLLWRQEPQIDQFSGVSVPSAFLADPPRYAAGYAQDRRTYLQLMNRRRS